jgi:predicted amidophosphoribosyltransferase
LRWIHAVYAPWFYRGSGGAIVRRFKFEGCPVAGERMLHAMRRALGGSVSGEGRRTKVVAVPMHRQRRREHGYDQAERLAIGLGDLLGLSYQDGVLVRRRATLSQADPRVTSREANVAGAFHLARPAAVEGAGILLVDDVCTSGATARACAAVLRAGGAHRVALVVAALAHPERADPDPVS